MTNLIHLICRQHSKFTKGLLMLWLLQPSTLQAGEESDVEDVKIVLQPEFATQISQLAQLPMIQSAFQYIAGIDARTVKNTILLTEIPSPPFKEALRAHKFAEMLRAAGIDSVGIDAEGNVVGLRRGSERKRVVAVTAHLDTVFPEETDVRVQIRGDTLFAPGIGDDARGLAVLLTILEALAHNNIRASDDLLFIGTVGEEGLGDLRGAKFLFSPLGPRIDTWITVDSNEPGLIVNSALGSLRYKVTFTGPGGHSWRHFGIVNPHHAIGRAIHHFVEVAAPVCRTGEKTTYNVGRTGGGLSINSIPSDSWMEVDMRSVSQPKLKELEKIFLRAVQHAFNEENKARMRGPEMRVKIEKVGDRPSGAIKPTVPVVQRAIATYRYFGIEPIFMRLSTDANIPISRNMPAITISRGGAQGREHSQDEWWFNQDGHRDIQRIMLLILSEAGYSGK